MAIPNILELGHLDIWTKKQLGIASKPAGTSLEDAQLKQGLEKSGISLGVGYVVVDTPPVQVGTILQSYTSDANAFDGFLDSQIIPLPNAPSNVPSNPPTDPSTDLALHPSPQSSNRSQSPN